MAIDKVTQPPKTGKVAWLLQIGWIFIATSYESLFTKVPILDSVQFTVLMITGVAMIISSITLSYLVFKMENDIYIAKLKTEPPSSKEL